MAEYKINENLCFSLNTHKTRLNNNFAFIGSPGSGKTHLNSYNIMNMTDRSHIIVDVKGNLSGFLNHFEKHGYTTYHFNLVDVDHSDTYSLFSYVDSENIDLSLDMIANAMYGEVLSKDPFWDCGAIKILKTCLCGIYEGFDEDDRNLYKINNYIKFFYMNQDDFREHSGLKDKINQLSVCYQLKSKDSFFSEWIKTVLPFDTTTTKDCLLQSLETKLSNLLYKKVCALISQRGIDFEDFINQKTCLVITIDDSDPTFHSICGLFLTQLFQYLYKKSREMEGNTLPIPIHFHLDDFGSYFIKNFPEIISTARSRNIGISCLFQSQGQLKKRYGMDSETIMQCFDTILFFGGIDIDTTQLISMRSGNSDEYIASQDLNTCYILRRGIPVLYEKVLDLSDFIVPKSKKHEPTKFYIRSENDNFLNKKIACRIYDKLYDKLKSREKERNENVESRGRFSHVFKRTHLTIKVDKQEFRFIEYMLNNLEVENKIEMLKGIENAKLFFRVVPDNVDIIQEEIIFDDNNLPVIFSYLDSFMNKESDYKK